MACCRTLPADFAQGAGSLELNLAGNKLVRLTCVGLHFHEGPSRTQVACCL